MQWGILMDGFFYIYLNLLAPLCISLFRSSLQNAGTRVACLVCPGVRVDALGLQSAIVLPARCPLLLFDLLGTQECRFLI